MENLIFCAVILDGFGKIQRTFKEKTIHFK